MTPTPIERLIAAALAVTNDGDWIANNEESVSAATMHELRLALGAFALPQAPQGWVACETKPEKTNAYYVTIYGNGRTFVTEANWLNEYSGWHDDDGDPISERDWTVTHWMGRPPLPTPPAPPASGTTNE